MPRPQKSAQQHLADGTFRPERHGDKKIVSQEPVLTEIPEYPTPVVPDPKWAPRLEAWWNYYCQLLIDAGILVRRDLPCLWILCDTHVQQEMAEAELEGMPRFPESEKGTIQAHPAIIRRETAIRQVASLHKELCLTPSARAKGGVIMQDPAARLKESPVRGRQRG